MSQNIRTHILPIGDFTFDNGETLPGMQLAYETYGELNPDKSNAILLFHALTGSHHAHGLNASLPEAGDFWQPENFEGWWDRMIGPGKPLDTEKYFIICINYLGSCYGSSGPTSPAPDGEPWGSRFPLVNANDQARSQIKVLDYFGIDRFTVVGPSLGGMLSLSLASLYPTRIKNIIIIGAGYKPAIEHKLDAFEQILAIELDPAYREGRYPLNDPPRRGLALARMISHKLFVNQRGLEKRARKGVSDRKGMLTWYMPQRNTESYMLHQGTKFAKRYDANAYIRIINLWAGYDLATFSGLGSVDKAFKLFAAHGIRFMLFSINTDCCFTARDISCFHRKLLKNGVDSRYKCIHSVKGHDSFLLEPELYEEDLKAYLN